MDEKREVREADGCLILSKITYPQKNIIKCKFCPARSDMVTDLGKLCKIEV